MASPGSNSWIDRKISAPTLLIWGEQDFALGKELTYGMEGLFTGPFEIKYIADSGHWVQQEKPELVNQYVRDFLDPTRPRSSAGRFPALTLHRCAPRLSSFQDRNASDAAFLTDPGQNPGWSSV